MLCRLLTTAALQRKTFSAQPPGGDYILRPSDFSRSVRRSHANGTADSLSDGERDRQAALAAALACGGVDGV